MLTKEECENAVASAIEKTTEIDEYESIPQTTYCIIGNELNTFKQLINEHFELVDLLKKHDLENLSIKELDKWFDRSLWHVNKVNELSKKLRVVKSKQERIDVLTTNSPLKFDELHEGMWVWDNNDNKYNKIIEINNNVIEFYYVTNSQTRFSCKFEKNRFYRREVNNDE